MQRLGLGEGRGRTPTTHPHVPPVANSSTSPPPPQLPLQPPTAFLQEGSPHSPGPCPTTLPVPHPLVQGLSATRCPLYPSLQSQPPVLLAGPRALALDTNPGFSTSLPGELPQAYPRASRYACGRWGEASGTGRDPSSGGSQALNISFICRTNQEPLKRPAGRGPSGQLAAGSRPLLGAVTCCPPAAPCSRPL